MGRPSRRHRARPAAHMGGPGCGSPCAMTRQGTAMSALENRVRKLEQTPAYATRLLAQQARDKLADGVPVERLTDAELDALCENIPATEKAPLAAQIAALSDAE